MTKQFDFNYDHLCDLLYTILPADFKTELARLNLPEQKLRSLLKRHAHAQRQRIKEIEVEVQALRIDKDEAAAHLAAVSELLT